MKKANKRKIDDSHKAIRKDQPKVSKSISQLVDQWHKSDDKKAYAKRFGKRK